MRSSIEIFLFPTIVLSKLVTAPSLLLFLSRASSFTLAEAFNRYLEVLNRRILICICQEIINAERPMSYQHPWQEKSRTHRLDFKFDQWNVTEFGWERKQWIRSRPWPWSAKIRNKRNCFSKQIWLSLSKGKEGRQEQSAENKHSKIMGESRDHPGRPSGIIMHNRSSVYEQLHRKCQTRVLSLNMSANSQIN